MSKGKRIGILTAGGDCPGLNAAIRGVGKTAIIEHGMEVFGFSDGFTGLIHNDYKKLTEKTLSGILTLGGTILGTSREKPFKSVESGEELNKPEMIKKTYKDLKLDCIVCIGGNGTMKTAYKLVEEGLNVVGVPKTIDNDVWGTDVSFGFDSAVNIATEAIDRLHTTANSHKRTMVVEVMGNNAGWLTLYSGLASGGDVILIPEIEYSEDVLCEYLENRRKKGKPYSIIVVAEGITVPEKKNGKKRKISAGNYISRRINELTGIETRETILGYIQRGGIPSPMDRVIATGLGAYAAELISRNKFGFMSAYQGNEIAAVPLSEVAGKLKTVPVDHPLITRARSLDTCFGDVA